ncbi:MBL fold metallo-hydrolase [Neobacillus sp. FSL H8-0543]|uniref:MBL fold metallo-hydrolase n=1 Tax=Neobacillus sp. FSL H8-0543 TaxID=2954672 RepID=UPI0031582EEA
MNKPEKSNSDQYPKLLKVTEDIYQLKVRYPFGMYEMNSFLFKGDNGFTVVDTGSASAESQALWEQTIASGITVEKLVLSHAHPDHIGLARWFQEKHQVPVYISSLGYKEIQRKRNNTNPDWMRNLFLKHDGPELPVKMENPEADAFEFEPDGLFDNQEHIRIGNDTYETIWTPGHSSDHFCFYSQREQVMVTGDHVLAGLAPIIAVWSEHDVNPIKDNIASLERLKAYSSKIALPGHGDLIYNLNDRIDEMISGHQHRLQQLVASVKNAEKTSWQVCQEIYGTLDPKKFFAPLLATITRFLYLESIGEVASELKNGKIYYYRSNDI